MSIKIIFMFAAIVLGMIAIYPYIRDIIAKKTQPHVFTWLIWGLTQGTAAAGLWVGGGGIGAVSLTLGTAAVAVVFLMSLKDGKKNITKSDVVVLIVALSAIVIWWLLDNPLFAVLLVTGIDVIGYIPTIRKSYTKPWAETAFSWGGFGASNICAIIALESYNLLTMSYLVCISAANIFIMIFLLIRRQKIQKPKNHK